ncbi:MAG TPA: hypothetical protein V6C97_32465 [Oculatellaceae cyanobacterium]
MQPATIVRIEQPDTDTMVSSHSKEETTCARATVSRYFALAMIAAAACVVLLELASRYYVFVAKPANSNNPQYDSKFRVANTLSPTEDNIIFCGDSLCKEGVYPELITAKLRKVDKNAHATNLAITGGTQKDAVHYLEYLAHRGVRPRLVVFDYEVSNTCLPTEANNIEWGQSHSYLFRAQLDRPRSLKGWIQIFPSDVSYLMRQRSNIKRSFNEFLQLLKQPSQFETKSFFDLRDAPEHEVSRSGMAPNNKLDGTLNWEEESHKIGFFKPYCPQSPNFKFNPDAYSIIIKYCQDKKIPLLLVWLPHQSRVYDDYYYKAPYDAKWQQEQFEALGKKANVSTEFLNTLPDDPIYFHDYRHLNTYGCIKTSEILADVLAKPKYIKLLEGAKP